MAKFPEFKLKAFQDWAEAHVDIPSSVEEAKQHKASAIQMHKELKQNVSDEKVLQMREEMQANLIHDYDLMIKNPSKYGLE